MEHPGEDCDGCDMLKGMTAVRKKKRTKKIRKVKKEEPLDLTQLGNSTWGLLHTIAAYYPEQPSEHKQKHTRFFLQNLGEVFPCSWCAEDWKDVLDRKPPVLDSQPEFAEWLCEAHNDINVRLGKPEFPCADVNKRWRIEKQDLI